MLRHAYSNSAMTRAVNAVRDKTLTPQEAAHVFGVPLSTLETHLKKSKGDKEKPSNLTLSEENEQWLSQIAKQNELSPASFRHMASRIFWNMETSTGIPFKASKVWLEGFMKRHPDITFTHSASGLDCIKGSGVTGVEKVLSTIDDAMKCFKIPLQNVWAMDELAVPRDFLYHKKEEKFLQKRISMMVAASASGNALPPVYVVPAKRFVRATDLDDAPIGSGILHTAKGFVTAEAFKAWLEFFHRNTVSPRLLLLPYSAAHVTQAGIDFAKKNSTAIVLLDTESMDVLSPLTPILHQFGIHLREYHQQYFPTGVNMRCDQIGATSLPFDQAFSRVNIISGFEHAGITQPNRVIAARKTLLQRVQHLYKKEEEPLDEDQIAARMKHVMARRHDLLLETKHVLTCDQFQSLQEQIEQTEAVAGQKRSLEEVEPSEGQLPQGKIHRVSLDRETGRTSIEKVEVENVSPQT